MHKDLVKCFKTEDRNSLEESQLRVVFLVEYLEQKKEEQEYEIISLKDLIIKLVKEIYPQTLVT